MNAQVADIRSGRLGPHPAFRGSLHHRQGFHWDRQVGLEIWQFGEGKAGERMKVYKRRARSRGPGTLGSTQAPASHLRRRARETEIAKTQER